MNANLTRLRDKFAEFGHLNWWFLSPMAISILCKELVEKDFVVVDDFCSKKDCARLRDFIVEKRTQDKMLSGTEWLSKVRKKGKNVRKEYVERLRKTTRSDLVFWCNGDRKGEECVSDYAERLSTLLDKLKGEINELKQVESRSEAMLTCYPPGGSRYSIHVDNPDPSKSKRKLTAILYLNPTWNKSHGGELEIYDAKTQKVPRNRIEPHEARLLLFWSDKRVPHAVLPTYSNRYAVTIWLYVVHLFTRESTPNHNKMIEHRYATPPKKKKNKTPTAKSPSVKDRMIRAREEVSKLRSEVERLVNDVLPMNAERKKNESKKKKKKETQEVKKKTKPSSSNTRTKLSSSATQRIRDIAKAYQNETSKQDQDEALLQLAYDLPDNVGEIPVADALRTLIAENDTTREETIKSFKWGDSEKFVKIYIPMRLGEDDTVSIVEQEKRKVRVEFRVTETRVVKVLELNPLPGDVKKVTWKRKVTEAKGEEVVVVIWKCMRGKKWDLL